jgi:hypothetical protein
MCEVSGLSQAPLHHLNQLFIFYVNSSQMQGTRRGENLLSVPVFCDSQGKERNNDDDDDKCETTKFLVHDFWLASSIDGSAAVLSPQ